MYTVFIAADEVLVKAFFHKDLKRAVKKELRGRGGNRALNLKSR